MCIKNSKGKGLLPIGEFQTFFSIFKCCNPDAKKLLETTMLKPDGHLLVPAQVVHLSLLELKMIFFRKGDSWLYTQPISTNIKLKIGGFRIFIHGHLEVSIYCQLSFRLTIYNTSSFILLQQCNHCRQVSDLAVGNAAFVEAIRIGRMSFQDL